MRRKKTEKVNSAARIGYFLYKRKDIYEGEVKNLKNKANCIENNGFVSYC